MKTTVTFVILVFLLSLLFHINVDLEMTTAICETSILAPENCQNGTWTNAWTLTEDYQNGTYKSTVYPTPQVVWNGSHWVKYIYEEHDDHYLLRNGFITAEVYDYYATFYDVNYTEVRLQEERWEVQKWDSTSGQWENVEVGTPTFTEVVNETGIYLTKSSTSQMGVFNITYALKIARPLEHFGTILLKYLEEDGNENESH